MPVATATAARAGRVRAAVQPAAVQPLVVLPLAVRPAWDRRTLVPAAGPTRWIRSANNSQTARTTAAATSGTPDLAGYTRSVSVRPIVLLGDPRLRLKGAPVSSFGKYLHELL